MRISPLFSGLILAGALSASALLSGAAVAQNAPQPESTAPTDVKPIGDWTVRCFPVTSTHPCDMYEELDDKNSRQRVVGVSIAFMPSNNDHVAQIAVPLGVRLSEGAVIKTDNFTSPKLPFRRCDHDGCYVELILPPEFIDNLTKSSPQATINIVADNGRPFALRFSLNGFPAAHDAMASLAKEKAKGAAPASLAAPPPQ